MATTVLHIRMDEDLKNEAAALFEKMGMDLPTAIRVFLERAVAEKAIPFEVREPRATYSANRGIAALRVLQAQAEANGVAGMSEEEIEKWRNDNGVTDDSVSKILNKKSRELPDLKKVSKIWG